MKCEACERGDHANCGMQTWCKCDCAGPDSIDFGGEQGDVFVHITPSKDSCEHDWGGWRDFDDGSGGEQVCSKCGMGAMTYSLRYSD